MLLTPDQSDLLKLGVYTRQHAAFLARLRPRTAAQWFDVAAPVIQTQMPANDDGLVSFVDLIQLLGVAEIRRARKLSLNAIRGVVDKAWKEFGVQYPFARHESKVFLLGQAVVLKLPTGDYVEVTGPTKHNYLMEPVVLPYLQDLTFGPDELPNEYRPLPGILLSPKREWGAPVMEESGYTVETLVRTVQTEGSIEAAADACGVTQDEIKKALRYNSFLAGVAA